MNTSSEVDNNIRVAAEMLNRVYEKNNVVVMCEKIGRWGLPTTTQVSLRNEYVPGTYRTEYRGGQAIKAGEEQRIPGYFSFVPVEPSDKMAEQWVDFRPFQLGEAVYDVENRTIVVKAGDTAALFEKVKFAPHNLLGEINNALSLENSRLLVWKLSFVGDLHKQKKHYEPKVTNDQISVNVSGYAVDRTSETLIYLGMIGHENSINSIRATMTRNKSVVFNNTPDLITGIKTADKYLAVTVAIPEARQYHSSIVSRLAVPSKYEGGDPWAYALEFNGANEDRESIIYSRLFEVLEVPTKKSWANALVSHGLDSGLLQDMLVYGDVTYGVRINVNQEKWNALITNMVKARFISISSIEGSK